MREDKKSELARKLAEHIDRFLYKNNIEDLQEINIDLQKGVKTIKSKESKFVICNEVKTVYLK